ncbi:type IV secretion system protein VirB10 [Cupriavidus necator]
MISNDVTEKGRGLPSVNESRTRRSRVFQWFFIVGIVASIAAASLWFLQESKGIISSQSKNPSPATPQPIPSRTFELPPQVPANSPASAPSPELPQVAIQSLPPPVLSAQVPATSPVASDRMMLTEGGASATVGGALRGALDFSGSELRSQQASKKGQSNNDEGSVAGLLKVTPVKSEKAAYLGDRNLILAKGNTIDCILNTRLVSTVPGLTSCVVARDVFSDNGKVLLVEKGSMITGEYSSTIQLGRERIFVLWDRIKTTQGVVIQVTSPAADELGAAGVSGDVDHHWMQRIGASVLLSLVGDAFAYKSAQELSRDGGTVVLPGTSRQTESIAGKILDKTINIPSTLSRNQGTRVSVFVARDLDFSSVYELH